MRGGRGRGGGRAVGLDGMPNGMGWDGMEAGGFGW